MRTSKQERGGPSTTLVELRDMTAKDHSLITSNGLSHAECYEKSEFLARAEKAVSKLQTRGA